MNNLKEFIRQYVFITSVLSGFSFSIVYQLFSLENKERISNLVISFFALASITLLLSTIIGVFLLIRLETITIADISVQSFRLWSITGEYELSLLLIGLTFFSIGYGLSGWIKARVIGVVTSTSAAFVLAIIFWMFFTLLPS
jgi:hypothetical protein